MIGIFIDHDRIVIPVPIADIIVIVRRHTEVPAVEPEAIAVSSSKMIFVPAPEAARETAMFPRSIEVIVLIVASGIVSNPSVIVVDMRNLRMTRLIAKRTMILLWAAFLWMVFLRPIFLWATLLGTTLRGAIFLRAIFGPAIFRMRRRTMCGNVASANIASAPALLVHHAVPDRGCLSPGQE
jgi:hypothetical protein